jgi:hypothetical protein
MSEEKNEGLDRWDNLVNILTGKIEIDGKKVSLKDDFEKFFIKSNKTAGTRIRKAMQMLRREAEEVRKDIQRNKKSQ